MTKGGAVKLVKLGIKNVRAFTNVDIDVDPYTCFVGPNGAGKSTILSALNIFFKDSSGGTNVENLSDQDFYMRNTAVPVEITLFFSALSPEAQEDFKDYYRDGTLVVSAKAVFNPESQMAPVKQYGKRLGVADFIPYFAAQSARAKVTELRPIFNDIRERYTALRAASTGPAMVDQLREYEQSHPAELTLIDSDDEFYGFAGAGRLEKYIQWV